MRIKRGVLIGFIRDPAMILALVAFGILRTLIAVYRMGIALKGVPLRTSDRRAEHAHDGSVILRAPERPKKMSDILIQQ